MLHSIKEIQIRDECKILDIIDNNSLIQIYIMNFYNISYYSIIIYIPHLDFPLLQYITIINIIKYTVQSINNVD